MARDLEHSDIQGIILSAYSKLTCASYVLLRVDDAAKAKTWLASIAGEVTTAQKPRTTPATNLNIAITYTGLQALGVSEDVLVTFSFPFIDGMHSDRRARILGDTNENAPNLWWWGNPANRVDILLLLYAIDEPTIDAYETAQADRAKASGMTVVKEPLRAGRQPDAKEHFGFNDGVGQPTIEGTELYNRQLARTGHATALPPGEFLMSHEDAYGTIAPSPAVAPSLDPRKILSPSVDAKTQDLGRNGSYMVFRQLEQDVPGFWRFLDEQTRTSGVSRPAEMDKLGAKLVGRWRSGTPLVDAPDHDTWTNPATLNDTNKFDYTNDPHGFACPVGAHIRRSNPRDSLGPDPETGLLTANRHRLLRRARSYGHRLATDTNPMPTIDDGEKRGLHFICFNSDLQRQFEFVQQTWVNNPQFGGLANEVDPLIGDQQSCEGIFTVQADPLRTRYKNMCRFVTMRGGVYGFLPGIRALRWLSA
ncbi:MAG TPA: Dyp-type peroxidase [Thermoanaerobaculia bacterium]